MRLARLFRHLMTSHWRLHRSFPSKTLAAIEAAVREGERSHSGEIRFAVEAALDIAPLLGRQSARERALEVFSHLRVWDTERNNGVLIYVLLADRDVEIVADRGAHTCVNPDAWRAICAQMEQAFRRGEFEAGSLAGVRALTALLAKHYPPEGVDMNELPDKPVVL